MTNIIKFIATDRYVAETHLKPTPAKNCLPDWWKTMTQYDITEENPYGKNFDHRTKTFKKCMPLIDMLTSGYMIMLNADIQVDNGKDISWRVRENVISFEKFASAKSITRPEGFNENLIRYYSGFIGRTPKGYSSMITHPFGYQDLPFRTLSGVVDTDSSVMPIEPLFWMRENFNGVIRRGTPIAQIIPFKRENWKVEYEEYQNDEAFLNVQKGMKSNIVNHYITNHWKRKSFN
jgi:hypothetical protein